MPDITVVVPCYNVASCLGRCVESLLQQTLPVEILLINDGSTDGTLRVAQDYAAKYNNIRVLSKENQGLPQARRTGLTHVHTKYIGFIDSDDWAEPEMYEELYIAMTTEEAQIAVCGYYRTYEQGESVAEHQLLPDRTVLSGKEALHALHYRQDVFPYMWNKLYRTELIQSIDFPEGNFIGEDYVTTAQLLQKTQRVVTVKRPLHHYWQSNDSMSRGGFKDSHVQSYRKSRDEEKKMLSMDPSLAADVGCYLAVEYMAFVIAMSRNKQYNTEVLEGAKIYVRKHLRDILKAKDMSFLYKGSAVAFCIHHRLLTTVYKVVKSNLTRTKKEKSP